MIEKIISFSKKQLLLFAIIVTLLSGFVSHGNWHSGWIGGTGIGFPSYYWRNVTSTDSFICRSLEDKSTCKPNIVEADRINALILSIASFLGDILFWFIVLYSIKRIILFLKHS